MHDTAAALHRSGRAAPLPPDQRRTAILLAVQDIVLERGTSVSTKELAEAAGVAEGTLFRVFDDKATLVREAAFAAIDPSHMIPELAAIDRAEPLSDRVGDVLRTARTRVERVGLWMTLLHEAGRGSGKPPAPGHGGPPGGPWAERHREIGAAIRDQLTDVLAPDAARLRMPLDEAVDLLELVLVGLSMRGLDAVRFGSDRPAPATSSVVDLFLTGVLVPPDRPESLPEGSHPC